MNWYKKAQTNTMKEPWQMPRSEFRGYHLTGNIPSHAYDQYKTVEGMSWLKIEKYPVLYSTRKFGGKIIEFRKSGNPSKYVKTDKDGEIIRDANGMALYLSDEEAKAPNLTIEDPDIIAFDNGQAIGWAGDEFGATGVFVAEPYQKLGIGKYLLNEYRKGMPFSKRLGQATVAGYNLVGSWHKDLVEKALSEGNPVPPEVLADYPELQSKKQQEDLNKKNNNELV